MPRTRPPYPEEFRREAIHRAQLRDKSQRKVAEDLEISDVMLRHATAPGMSAGAGPAVGPRCGARSRKEDSGLAGGGLLPILATGIYRLFGRVSGSLGPFPTGGIRLIFVGAPGLIVRATVARRGIPKRCRWTAVGAGPLGRLRFWMLAVGELSSDRPRGGLDVSCVILDLRFGS